MRRGRPTLTRPHPSPTLTLTLARTLTLTPTPTLTSTPTLTQPSLTLTLTRCDEAVTRALVAQLARDMGDGSHPEEIVVAGAADEATNPHPALPSMAYLMPFLIFTTRLLPRFSYNILPTTHHLPVTTYYLLLTTYYRRSTASTC